jgi:pimeloyl-ACP methyl ester carboxylesterase
MRIARTIEVPRLPAGRIITLPGRGEIFVRHHQHEDNSRPTLLLLHGWTASADSQFFTAYETLSQEYSVIAVDHRGHGRGLRPNRPFTLEECADDAADVARTLGCSGVITVGYSMGGPISTLLWSRHPDLVRGMVFQATAMEWNGTREERLRWTVGRLLGPLVRGLTTPRMLRIAINRVVPRGHELHRYVPWIIGEIRRNDRWMVSEAGRALSRYDARAIVPRINVPTSVVLTLGDRLVPPAKQRALADAARAHVVELDGDHFVTLEQPREYADVTRRAVDHVVDRVSGPMAGA